MRSEARRGHKDQSVHEARSAECTDVSEWPLSASDLTMHATSCLNPIMTWIRAGASTTRVLVLPKIINMNMLKTLYLSTTRVLIFQYSYSYVEYSPQPWHELIGFDTLRSGNLLANFRSGRRLVMHCRKSMHGFASHVHGNAFVTS